MPHSFQGTAFNRSESSLSSMSFLDAPDYLELPDYLLMACNEDDKDNVSSESGGGTSSAGSLGSISNSCGTVSSAKTFETSNDSSLSNLESDKTLLERPTEHESHNNHNIVKSDTLEDDNAYVAPTEVDSSVQPVELNSGKEDTSEVQVTDSKPKSATVNKQNVPISFGWKTKAVIYGSVFSTIGYFVYTYWHIILMSLVALFFYEMWDLYSARKRKTSKAKSD